jgi:glycosyltransferase involved in cell wall biosynthesis
MPDAPERALDVAMFTPWHERCGIRDYSAHLIEALDSRPEIASTRIVQAPAGVAHASLRSALAHRREDVERFRQLGRSMNLASNIAHIQHQYFLFGGVSPLKSHIGPFLREIRVPAVMTVHEIAEPRGGFASRAAVATANRASFHHPAVTGLIVHTAADLRRLAEMGHPADRLHLIRHPVPPARPMPRVEEARRAIDVSYPQVCGRRVVTLFGFLSIKKGHKIALEALSRLPNDVALIFAGDRHPDDNTDYEASLRAEIARLKLDDRVIVTGYLPDDQVPVVMAATDVAIAPFLRSSGSGSLANLLAYGRAVVASDIEPHRELLADEPGLLLLAPKDDPERLAEATLALLADAPQRESLQRSALAYAARRTYLEMARETVQVYRHVLAG